MNLLSLPLWSDTNGWISPADDCAVCCVAGCPRPSTRCCVASVALKRCRGRGRGGRGRSNPVAAQRVMTDEMSGFNNGGNQ